MAAPCCLGMWSSLSACDSVRVSLCVPMSSSKGSSQDGLGPTLMTSAKLSHPFKSRSYKYSRLLSYWGLGFQHMKVGFFCCFFAWGHNSAHNRSSHSFGFFQLIRTEDYIDSCNLLSTNNVFKKSTFLFLKQMLNLLLKNSLLPVQVCLY